MLQGFWTSAPVNTNISSALIYLYLPICQLISHKKCYLTIERQRIFTLNLVNFTVFSGAQANCDTVSTWPQTYCCYYCTDISCQFSDDKYIKLCDELKIINTVVSRMLICWSGSTFYYISFAPGGKILIHKISTIMTW